MIVSPEILSKYNLQGPRYTSYPPATAFHNEFTGKDFLQEIELSNTSQPENLSIYIHIPFCPQRCFFCGCNTTCFESDEKVGRYISRLKKEISTVAAHLAPHRKVTQIHWGGGTPNSIRLLHVKEIMDHLHLSFPFSPDAEIAMECNPAYLEYTDMDFLAENGFNRMSLGIQDFHSHILEAINRIPPKHPLKESVKYLRQAGFSGINFDLVYGLPLQTRASFSDNIQQALELDPDRIVTFSYAHVPWFNENQKKLESFTFPTPDEKLSMLTDSINTLTQNSYESIGMDHFAKKTDTLSIAKYNKNLHRNFQGYVPKNITGQVYAFGSSSISQLSRSYAQNTKSLEKYMAAVDQNGIATERGYRLSQMEQVVKHVIHEVMCNGYVNLEDTAGTFNRSVSEITQILDFNVQKIEPFMADNLLSFQDHELIVNEAGMLFVRNIAMALDPALDKDHNKFSRTV